MWRHELGNMTDDCRGGHGGCSQTLQIDPQTYGGGRCAEGVYFGSGFPLPAPTGPQERMALESTQIH